MKYRQGGEIELGDWVRCKTDNLMGEVIEIDERCGLLRVWWEEAYRKDLPFWFSKSERARPKSIKPAEPEDLI